MKTRAYEQYLKESNNWLHRGRQALLETCLAPYCLSQFVKKTPQQILDVGSGSGKNIEILSTYGVVDVIECEPLVSKILANNSNVRQLYVKKVPFPLNKKYDIICAMDFLEHVEHDQAVFNWMVDHLNENGILFVTVPAYPILFSYHDIALGHFRRYKLNSLIALSLNRISLIKKGYFNFFLFPIAILSRTLESMRSGNKKKGFKQSSNVNSYLDFVLFQLLQIEIHFIRKYSVFPWGLTAFALFKKNCDRK